MVASPRRPGFTLFQLLIVLALLALLLALLLPAVQRARQAAVRAKCANNQKQLVLAIHNINDVYESKLPPAVGEWQGNPPGTLFYHMLPFIEQEPLYKQSKDQDGYFIRNGDTQKNTIQVFISPLDTSVKSPYLYDDWLATTSYAANFQVFGNPAANSMQGAASIPRSIPDGTSQTILFATRYQLCNNQPCAWGYYGESTWAPVFAYQSTGKFQVLPKQSACDPALAQALTENGTNVGMGDGSVHFVSAKVSPQTWWAACTPAGNDELGDDW
jgi:type II secretory pathway pseudopilin PulG